MLFPLLMASIHHLVAFGLLAILVAEIVLVVRLATPADIARLARIDLGYGLLAMLLLAAGLVRAIYTEKGWGFYAGNPLFWAKLGAFALIALLSLPPTLAYVRWRRQGSVPDAGEVSKLRGYMWCQLGLFALLPIFAAAMARGVGLA